MSTATFSAGTLPVWEGYIDQVQSRTEVDALSGIYRTPRSTTLAIGDAVPGFPGMIIQKARLQDTGISKRWSLDAEGSLDNSSATKLLSRSETRPLSATWDTFSERKISWLTAPRAITGTASTDVITTTTAHGYADGQRVILLGLTGGAGLTGQSDIVLGTIYFVRDATSTTFKLSATSGGSVADFTTNITAGSVIAAEFCPGTVHPDYPAMYLTGVTLSDNYSAWRTAECTYTGKLWGRSFQRTQTCNGQQFSSSSKITLSATGGWPSTPQYTNFILPEVVVTDTYITTTAPGTGSIPGFSTPVNAPSVISFTITGGDLTYNYPYGWIAAESSKVETLCGVIDLHVQVNVWRYVWPMMFR